MDYVALIIGTQNLKIKEFILECEFMRQFWGKSTIWGRNEHANRPSCQLRETGT